MQKTSFVAALVVLSVAGAAHAGGQPNSIGVGAEYQLSGLGGASINYDAGKFHVGGFLGYFDPAGDNNTIFELGGRFYYHVHSTGTADFGVGGGISLASIPTTTGGMMPMTTRKTDVYLEPGFQIRVFIGSNVALSFNGGISIGVVDADGTALTGQTLGSSLSIGGGSLAFIGGAGVHYYFF